MFLWPTWSAETQECPCVFLILSRFHFHLTMGVNKELESVQWPRWFPIQMETKYYQPGYCGRSHPGNAICRGTSDHPPPQLQDPNNNVIAFVRPTRPTRYQGLGDVYAELHFVRSAGAGVVVCSVDMSKDQQTLTRTECNKQMHPPLMDTVTVTAMLYRFASAFNL